MKTCCRCKETKSLDDFHNNASNASGKARLCKECQSANNRRWNQANKSKRRGYELKRLYGLTPEQYHMLLIEQAGRCAICTNPMIGYGEPAVEHDHTTNLVRGLTCRPCNLVLGLAGDSITRLLACAQYIALSQQPPAAPPAPQGMVPMQ